MVEDLPLDFVPRPQEFDALISKLLDQRREEPVAITAALAWRWWLWQNDDGEGAVP